MKPEVLEAINALNEANIEYKIYNNGIQINAKDLEGIVHTFYPTTGTIILHHSNDKYDRWTMTFKDKTITNFIKGLKFKGLVKFYFKEI